MDPNDESNQLRWHPGSTRMPIIIEGASEPAPAHSQPRPAVQQPRTVRPSAQHRPPFANSEDCPQDERPRAPMLTPPDCRHRLAAECAAASARDHSYSSRSNSTSSPPTTPGGEILPPNNCIGEQEHARNSDSAAWPIFELPSRQLSELAEGTTRQVPERQSPEQPRVTLENTDLGSRSLCEMPSTPAQMRSNEQPGSRAPNLEKIRRNIGKELELVSPRAKTQQFTSPIHRSVGATPFCSTPRKQYSNGVRIPDSSSCPASPLGPFTNADRQPADKPRLCHTAPLDQQLCTLDGKQAQAVHSVMESQAARRNYAARQPRPRFPRKTESRAQRKRTAAGDRASRVNTYATNDKKGFPRSVPSRHDWEQSLPVLADISGLLDPEERLILQPSHLQMLPDTAAQSGALTAAVAHLDRTAPQMMQLMLGIGRTWEAVQEAWSSFKKVSTCFEALQGPLESVENSLKEAQRLHTGNANNSGNIPRQGTPDQNAQNCQQLRSDGSDGELTRNCAPPHVTGLNLSPEIDILATYATADMQSSVSRYKADIAKVRESLGEQSSPSSSGGRIAPIIRDTEARGVLPALALTNCAAAKAHSQKPATGIAVIAQPKQTEVKLSSSVVSRNDKMREPESRGRPLWSYGDPVSSKKPTSEQLPHSLDIHGRTGNVRVRARKEMTPSRYWKAAAESSPSACSRSTTNLRSRTSVTTQATENILENHPYMDRLLWSSPSNAEQSKISPVQERTTNQEINLCGIGPPYEKTGGSLEGRGRPLTTEATSQFETRGWSATKKKSGLVLPLSTEGTKQCPTTAEEARSRNSDFSTADVDQNVKALLADAQELSRQNMAASLSHSMMPYWTMTRWLNEYNPRWTQLYGQPTYEHVDRFVRTRGALISQSGDRRDGQRPYAMEAAVPAPLVVPPRVIESIARNPGEMRLMGEERFDAAHVPYSLSRDQATVETKLEVSNSHQRIESSLEEARKASEKPNTASITTLSALNEHDAAKSAPTATRDVPVDEKAFGHTSRSFQEPVKKTQMQNRRQCGQNEDRCSLRCTAHDPLDET